MIHDKTIRVGACDWDHAHWQGDFYPDDLPQDWRLSYYANEFSTVLVPEARWRAEGVDFEQWAEDVHEGFRFYFLTADRSADETQIKSCLGAAFAGFVQPENDSVALINFETKKLREWKDWLLQTDCEAVFLMDENLAVKQLAEFRSLIELMGL